MTFDSDGNLFVESYNDKKLYKITPDLQTVTIHNDHSQKVKFITDKSNNDIYFFSVYYGNMQRAVIITRR